MFFTALPSTPSPPHHSSHPAGSRVVGRRHPTHEGTVSKKVTPRPKRCMCNPTSESPCLYCEWTAEEYEYAKEAAEDRAAQMPEDPCPDSR